VWHEPSASFSIIIDYFSSSPHLQLKGLAFSIGVNFSFALLPLAQGLTISISVTSLPLAQGQAAASISALPNYLQFMDSPLAFVSTLALLH